MRTSTQPPGARIQLLLVSVLLLFSSLSLSVESLQASTQHSAVLPSWLNGEERAWLSEHPVVRLAPAPDFPPVEYLDENGRHQGIAADYIQEIGQMLGIRFEVVHSDSWSETLTLARQRKIDLVAEAVATPEREDFLTFTRPYLRLPAVIITHRDRTERTNMENLGGQTLAVVEGYAIHDWVQSRFPDIRLKPVPSLNAGLQLVADGEADAMIETNAAVVYLLERNGFTELQIAGDSGFVWRLAMGVRSDWPLLRDILQKALDRIPASRKNEIFENRVAVERHAWTPTSSFAGMVATATLLFLIMVLLYRIRSFRRKLERQSSLLEQKQQELESLRHAFYQQDKSFNLLFSAIDLPLALHELNGDLIQLNERALTLFRISRTELDHYKFPRDFIAPAQDTACLKSIWERIVSGQHEQFIITARTPRTGEQMQFEVSCCRIELLGRGAVLSCFRLTAPRPD